MKHRLYWLSAPLALAAIALAIAAPVRAQFTSPNSDTNPNSGFNENERNEGQSEIFKGGLNPMQLIHNANLKRSRDGGEFADDTQTNLSRSAEEFKRQQRQRLEQTQAQPQATPAPTATTPAQ